MRVFGYEGIVFHGGGTSRGLKLADTSLAVDLRDFGGPIGTTAVEASFPLSNANKWLINGGYLRIPIADHGIPALPKEFWPDLLKDLLVEKDRRGGMLDLRAFCMGGHGRTGMFLAIMYGLTHPQDQDPVDTIRKMYCINAVETLSQENYVYHCCGLPKHEKFSGTVSVSTGVTSVYSLNSAKGAWDYE